jgi:ribose transport system ATP-binding protein
MSEAANEARRPPRIPVLQLRNVSKTFNGVTAVADLNLDICAGEVLALMGENGAGKSTTIKMMTGAYRADPGGTYLFDGRAVDITGPDVSRRLGVAVIYQEHSLSPNLSVAENIYLGRELRTSGMLHRAAMEHAVGPVLERLGADFKPAQTVSSLSIAERQMVEIARALHFEARVLIMDEPTTSLSRRETDRLLALIKKLRDGGLAIVYISHRMDEVYELADRVSVLRDGRYVGTLERAELTHAKLVQLMVGRDLSGFYKKGHCGHSKGKPVLRVRDVTDGRRVRQCSLHVEAGEVLGLAGLVGSGRTELAHIIAGAVRRTGSVEVNGRIVPPANTGVAIRHGIVYLTEDRRGQGLFLDLSVHDNINVIVAGRDASAGVLDRHRATGRTQDAVTRLSIRAANAGINVGALSGGNQQKALLARLLAIEPQVLILDEPTRGVDVGAKSEIYRLIDELAQQGVAILVISSEMPEMVGISDRVLVMREGAIAGELRGAAITQEAIVSLATSQLPVAA